MVVRMAFGRRCYEIARQYRVCLSLVCLEVETWRVRCVCARSFSPRPL